MEDYILSKQDLTTFDRKDLHVLYEYYSIPNHLRTEDKLWLLALAIFDDTSITKGTMTRSGIKANPTIDEYRAARRARAEQLRNELRQRKIQRRRDQYNDEMDVRPDYESPRRKDSIPEPSANIDCRLDYKCREPMPYCCPTGYCRKDRKACDIRGRQPSVRKRNLTPEELETVRKKWRS